MKERIVFIVVLIVLAVFSYDKITKLSSSLKTQSRIIKNQSNQLEAWTDAQGRYHARSQAAVAEISILKTTHAAELDSIKEVFGKRVARNLESYTGVEQVVSDTITLTVKDTVLLGKPLKHIRFQDPYLYLDGNFDPLSDSLTLEYKLTTPIEIVTYSSRKWFLGRKSTLVEVVAKNPNATITGITQMTVKEKPHRMGLSVQAGYGLQGPYIGLGFGYTLIRF